MGTVAMDTNKCEAMALHLILRPGTPCTMDSSSLGVLAVVCDKTQPLPRNGHVSLHDIAACCCAAITLP